MLKLLRLNMNINKYQMFTVRNKRKSFETYVKSRNFEANDGLFNRKSDIFELADFVDIIYINY
jgi:hypothetical protein